MRTLTRTVARTGVLQIDSVNVLQRAHYMPLLSRMGPYDTTLLTAPPARHRAAWSSTGRTWPAFMPVDLWPLMAFRWRRYREHGHEWSGCASAPSWSTTLLARGARRGPPDRARPRRRPPGDRSHWGWNWSEAKKALEFLFFTGELAVARRNGAFERVYDLPERVLPAAVLATPESTPPEAHRELVRRAARSHGVATEACLRDYYRMHTDLVGPAVRSLVEDGELLPVTVEGWARPAYLHRDARLPRRVAGPSPAQPLRPGRVGAGAHRGALRLPLPDRDLRARGQAGARLLRAALPARRGAGRPGRPQGGPGPRPAAGPGCASPNLVLPATPPPSSPRRCGSWPTGSAWAVSRWDSAGTWSSRCGGGGCGRLTPGVFGTLPAPGRVALGRVAGGSPHQTWSSRSCLPSSTRSCASAKARSSASSKRSPRPSTPSRTTSSR